MAENLEATVDIIAPPERVWRVVSDLDRMSEFSPTTRRMKTLGTPKAGAWTVNWNKKGWKVWPTSSRIVSYDPERELAFRMNENGTTWSFTLEPTATGTRLTQRRDASAGVPWPIRKAIDVFFGSETSFEKDLVGGMTTTLARIKAAAETA
ncbi:SRPBCC family protein [Nocardia shimofusensis]|uniref:SRPBCC family protein n=1 Tax=Nocardia shimofusensis TaxID=228596 RepID=UPI00082AF468|nr:SRPBCC family protein [Nocardia shimofusensis]